MAMKKGSLLPEHYDPFGIGRPELNVSKPQSPLLIVIDSNEKLEPPESIMMPVWVKWSMRTLIFIFVLLLGVGLWVQSLDGKIIPHPKALLLIY